MCKPRFLPERPSEDLLRRISEVIAYGLLEVLQISLDDGRTSDPAEIARHNLLYGVVAVAGQTVNALRELGHKVDYRFPTHGAQLRYLADLCDYHDEHIGLWKEWDVPVSLPAIEEGRPIPAPMLPTVRRTAGPSVRLQSVPC